MKQHMTKVLKSVNCSNIDELNNAVMHLINMDPEFKTLILDGVIAPSHPIGDLMKT